MAILESRVANQSPAFISNQAYMREQLEIFRERIQRARQGGGEDAALKHKSRGKMLARERIQALIDPGTEFLEFSALAAYDMYEGDAPGAGLVTGLGVVSGRECVIVANDATVKGGTQNDLRNIITEYVQKNLPENKNLRFEKMWTETLNKNKVRAQFVYSFEDVDAEGEPATIEITGKAILNKIDETPEMVTWNLDELSILDNKVNFSEPIQITAGAGELESESPPAETKEKSH